MWLDISRCSRMRDPYSLYNSNLSELVEALLYDVEGETRTHDHPLDGGSSPS